MVRLMGRMPEADRAELIIEKSGDRNYGPAEAVALFKRDDFRSDPCLRIALISGAIT
ncbi:hypothetical protein ACFS32_14855 [Novosphingobium pokkalii]|uniref:hypothetical protein n=1 Tax=Novosphingobium pokkalii TaxID=1770194 RepID=UPI003635D8FA